MIFISFGQLIWKFFHEFPLSFSLSHAVEALRPLVIVTESEVEWTLDMRKTGKFPD